MFRCNTLEVLLPKTPRVCSIISLTNFTSEWALVRANITPDRKVGQK